MNEPRSAASWDDGSERPDLHVSAPGWVVAVLRVIPLFVVLAIGLVATLVMLPLERLVAGESRPITPTITRLVCIAALAILGIGWRAKGVPMRGPGAVVANHSSWLDIFVLNAPKRLYFVSKAEVRDWPGIGWLARATGTVFIRRDRREAAAQVGEFRRRLSLGHRLLFFPEGTSTDSRRVLPFKTTLFAAFFADGLRQNMWVQPVSVVYLAPRGRDDRFYGWWGDMDLGPHLLAVLGAVRQGRVEIHYHDPVRVADFADRKMLAAHCEAAVRGPVLSALVQETVGSGGA
ncbi:lysophospholipid acyltransferase family protein [Maritimibacter sp. DP1N21-5]|uniref:lysophospholipid acyltransferase family protein n=1 Tax=Maritimibacter sp. DP1N21-5 TaxID=2836867 RepID=UPI001C486F33|nr:1-acyl-sn-glycerol-3-phosphate acyltransferase [Maritimibacter sp. DP1N21-5]